MIRFFTLIYLTFNFALSYSQNWDWVRVISGTANDTGYSIDVDDSGYVYMTGRCKWLTTFENNTSPYGPLSIGDRDVYISKYDKYGNLIWARLAGTEKAPYYDQGYSIVSDNNGGCYVTGIFNDTSFFGLDTLISAGMRDIFITHLNENGDFTWSKRFGGDGNATSHDYSRCVNIDNNGNVYIAGYIFSEMVVFSDTIGTFNQPSAILIKYSSNGDFLDYAHFDGPYKSTFEKFVFDDQNNIYVTGTLNGYGTLNGSFISTNNSAAWNDMCLIKMDENFNVIWSTTGGGPYYDIGNCIAIDGNSIYVGGSYSSTATFDTITTTVNSATLTGSASINHRDAYLASYDSTGHVKWLLSGGDEGIDEFFGLKVSKNGNLYTSGFFQDSISIGIDTLTSDIGITNGFIFKLDSNGNLIWSKNLSGANNIRCYELEIDNFENIYITGDFEQDYYFDSIFYSAQYRDAFGGKLLQHTAPSYKVDTTSSYCLGDTIIIEMTGLSSPLTYSYFESDGLVSWTDSNNIFYLVNQFPSMQISGIITTSNLYFSDSVNINLNVQTYLPIEPVINGDTVLCDTNLSTTLFVDDYFNSYLWSNNTSNNTNMNTFFNGGNYSITVSDSNSCKSTKNFTISFNSCVGVSETEDECNFFLSNNGNMLNCNCKKENITIDIYNLHGQIVFSKEINQNENIFYLGDLPNGIYFVKSKELKIQNYKFIISN